MKEIYGDIWNYYNKENYICITTNGFIKNNGCAVMGRGIALQCSKKFPEFPKLLGDAIFKDGNIVHIFNKYHIITIPVKHNWYEKGDLFLIEESIKQLASIKNNNNVKIYLTRPGCHNGKLDWKDVKPILEKYLDDNFIICDLDYKEDKEVEI
jgi:hypothetical protein